MLSIYPQKFCGVPASVVIKINNNNVTIKINKNSNHRIKFDLILVQKLYITYFNFFINKINIQHDLLD